MKSVRFLCLVGFIILVFAASASAMIPSFTYRGTVTNLDPAGDTITIEATHRWSCGAEGCNWMEIESQEMVSAVPVAEVYDTIRLGDTVEVAGLPDAKWNAIGLLYDDPGYGFLATDLFGDLGHLPAPLVGGYDISANTSPDCGSCSGTVCTAEYASVTVSRYDQERWNGVLFPGEEHAYYDPTDLSNVYVKFISGEASSHLCPDSGFSTGPQPFSRFIVHLNPSPITPATTGSVIVSSHPLGASVYLDRQYLGVAPLVKSGIESGVHSLLVEKEGYESWDSEIAVRLGIPTSVIARLLPLYGVLDVRSVPSGAEILVDGIASGYTPEKIEATPGVHVVTLTKEGYNPADLTAYVSAGGRTFMYKRLAPGGAVAAL